MTEIDQPLRLHSKGGIIPSVAWAEGTIGDEPGGRKYLLGRTWDDQFILLRIDGRMYSLHVRYLIATLIKKVDAGEIEEGEGQ